MTQADIFQRTNGRGHKAAYLGEAILLPDGSVCIRPASGVTLRCTPFARLHLQADGSLKISPMPKEIRVDEAAEMLNVSARSIFPLLTTYDAEGQPLIRARRPTFGRIWIETESVWEYSERSRDPEMWERLKRNQRLNAVALEINNRP
jgi:hypothetical protein